MQKKIKNINDCPITIFMEKIGGKWKTVIIYLLLANGTMRFSELERALGGITQKMLSQQLKSLEEDLIINRISYPVVPPKVEYNLTTKGKTLFSLLENIMSWSTENLIKTEDK
ncbi:winged helix-turn-helix transcriptional regulator [Flavobacterium aquicola]|uniref:HxlR family transcriptional regulator n=1 Tax=Flavobacterium aquicola TaxID=1682742 RepID=A0A3E0EMZ9_9FLAO|nr:helix-turn-helix domain-containing protein [Flavobacterium aquicola]REG99485.1 HxlR family transcriptional regulator [Flavobacterium aquicola]